MEEERKKKEVELAGVLASSFNWPKLGLPDNFNWDAIISGFSVVVSGSFLEVVGRS